MMRIRNPRKETIIEKYYIKDFAALFSHVIYLENKMHDVTWELQKICKTASEMMHLENKLLWHKNILLCVSR